MLVLIGKASQFMSYDTMFIATSAWGLSSDHTHKLHLSLSFLTLWFWAHTWHWLIICIPGQMIVIIFDSLILWSLPRVRTDLPIFVPCWNALLWAAHLLSPASFLLPHSLVLLIRALLLQSSVCLRKTLSPLWFWKTLSLAAVFLAGSFSLPSGLCSFCWGSCGHSHPSCDSFSLAALNTLFLPFVFWCWYCFWS